MKWSIVCSESKDMLPCRPEQAPDFTLPDVSSAKTAAVFHCRRSPKRTRPCAFFRFPVLPASTRSRFWNASPSARGHENHDRRHLAGQPARHCRFPQEYGVTFARSSTIRWLRGLKRLRADQCPSCS